MEQKDLVCIRDKCYKIRPIWQRIVYPFIGTILILIGLLGLILPVMPGMIFVLAGIPLVACIHPKLEYWVKHEMHIAFTKIKEKLRHKGINL